MGEERSAREQGHKSEANHVWLLGGICEVLQKEASVVRRVLGCMKSRRIIHEPSQLQAVRARGCALSDALPFSVAPHTIDRMQRRTLVIVATIAFIAKGTNSPGADTFGYAPSPFKKWEFLFSSRILIFPLK